MNFSEKRFAEFLQGLSPAPSAGTATGTDKRRATRVEVRNRVTISVCEGGIPIADEEVELRDFSPRGLKFIRAQALPAGEQFIFHAPQRVGPPVQILCTVAHCRYTPEGEIGIGAEFTCVLGSHVPDDQAEAQEAWIRKRMMD